MLSRVLERLLLTIATQTLLCFFIVLASPYIYVLRPFLADDMAQYAR